MKYGLPADPATQLSAKQVQMRKDLDEARKPRAGQIYGQLEQVEGLVNEIQQKVAELVEETTYSRDSIDGKFADLSMDLDVELQGKASATHTHDQADVSGVWTKGVNTSDAGRFDGGLASTAAYSLALTGSVRVASIDSTGRLGYSPSTRTMKTHRDVADFSDEQLGSITLAHFQYTREIELERLHNAGQVPYAWIPGYQAGTKLGVYAEDLHEAGLWEFVIYRGDESGTRAALDENGQPIPEGVRYELLSMILVPVVQRLVTATRQLRSDVDEIRQHLGL